MATRKLQPAVRLTKEQAAQAIEMHFAGKSAPEIATTLRLPRNPVYAFIKRTGSAMGWSTPIRIAPCEWSECGKLFVWPRGGGRAGVARYCGPQCQLAAHRSNTKNWRQTHVAPKGSCIEPGCDRRIDRRSKYCREHSSRHRTLPNATCATCGHTFTKRGQAKTCDSCRERAADQRNRRSKQLSRVRLLAAGSYEGRTPDGIGLLVLQWMAQDGLTFPEAAHRLAWDWNVFSRMVCVWLRRGSQPSPQLLYKLAEDLGRVHAYGWDQARWVTELVGVWRNPVETRAATRRRSFMPFLDDPPGSLVSFALATFL